VFSRLYLETSELVAAGWPRISADLENVLNLMASAKIPVLLPAGVEHELEQRWRRELREKMGALRSRIQAVEAHLGGVEDMKLSVDGPDPTRAAENYTRTVNKLKKYGISTVPFTNRPVAEIFAMAADRHPPFKEGKEDVGFRDASIFLSVVDHLSPTPGHIGALVARDEAFHDPRVVEFAGRAGKGLQVFRSVLEVFDSIMREAAAYAREQWSRSAGQAQRSLQLRLPEIGTFINDTLEIPEWGLVPGSRVVAVPRIEALEVRDVRVPIPLEVQGHERVRLSFDVHLKFHAKIETIELPQTRRLKIGSERSFPELLAALGAPEGRGLPIFATQSEEVEIDRPVRVEANADPNFTTFVFESASLIVDALPGLSGLSGLSTGL